LLEKSTRDRFIVDPVVDGQLPDGHVESAKQHIPNGESWSKIAISTTILARVVPTMEDG
jgi:hypothetical protein